MAKEPGFWSEEGFPYPLLALGQTFPKGYQYQSQMTPYARDARGDWGRALNESIDNFFAMWPQYMQQKRQFALQRNQLERQRLADQHQAKLRPYELKEAQAKQQATENRMNVLKNYPSMVESLPVSDKHKAYLKGLPPAEGLKMMQAFMTQSLKPRTKLIKAGQKTSSGDVFRYDVQEKADGTYVKSPIAQQKINVFPNEFFPGTERRNTSGVTIEYDPADGSFSYPLDNPPTQDFITVGPGQKFPDGSINNSARDQLFDRRNNKKVAYEGTTPQKELITIQPGGSFPDGTVHTGLTAIQFNPATKTITTPFGITPPKNLITVQPGEAFPDGTINTTQRPVQFDPVSKTITTPLGTAPPKKIERATKDHPQVVALGKRFGEEYVNEMLPFLTVDKTHSETGELQWPKGMETLNKELQEISLTAARPTPTQRLQAEHAEDNYARILSLADLAKYVGPRIEAQKNAALTALPKTHKLRQMAQYDRNRKFVEMGPNGVLISEGFKEEYNQPGRGAFTSGKPLSKRVNQGDTLDQIVTDFKAKGITVDPTQVVAANKHFFLDENGIPDPNKMKTSAQVGGAEMIIPTGGGSLDDFQIGESHRSDSPIGSAKQRTIVLPGIGTLHTFKNASIDTELALNKELGQMKVMQSNVQEMLDLLYDPKARNWFKLGTRERGKVNAIRWRLVNNIQVLRGFGVLTPGEIEVIEESLPDMNSFLNLLASDFQHGSFGTVQHRGKAILQGGSERFIEGALKALMSEAVTKQNELRAYMKGYDIPELGFQIDRYDPSSDFSPLPSGSKNFVDSFRSE